METGQVVIVERQGGLSPACLLRVGDKRVRARCPEGPLLKIPVDRILYAFPAPGIDPSSKDPAAATAAWFEDWKARTPSSLSLDPSALWEALEDGASYSLTALCELTFAEVTEAGLRAILELFSVRRHEFKIRNGGIERVDAETRDRITQRFEAEAREQREVEEFCEWFGVAEAGATPPHKTGHRLLDALRRYALEGSDGAGKPIKKLAAALGIRDPDELLGTLTERGWLPRHVNEVPTRANLQGGHSDAALAEVEARLAQLEGDPQHAHDARWSCRRRFEDVLTLTIDQPSTEDVDDALSFWEEEGGLGIAVHIADIDAAVPMGSALDLEAREKCSTIYFRDETWPMLPAPLIAAGVSLNVGALRPAVSLIASFDAAGELRGEPHFELSLVRVTERLSYADTRAAPWLTHPLLEAARIVTDALRETRKQAGAVFQLQRELRIDFPNGDLDAVEVEAVDHDTLGHALVSELMVFYGRYAAELLGEHHASAFFKIQPSPIPRRGRQISDDDPIAPLKRRYPPSRFSLKPGPHETMGVPAYIQATAPMRRYTDLIAQRQIKGILEDGLPRYESTEIAEMRGALEKGLSTVRRCEDLRIRYWIHRFLERRPGPRTAWLSRLDRRKRLCVYLRDIMLELPISGLPAELLERWQWRQGDAVEVLAKGSQPRQRWTRLEIVSPLPGASGAQVKGDPRT